MSAKGFGHEGRGRSRLPQDEERILREEEQALLRDEDRQLMHEDDRGLAVARVDGKCGNHPEAEASSACTECGKQLCPDCEFASGGGHSFCKECMNSSRLVDAEPQIIGLVTETQERVAPKMAVLVLVLLLGLTAIAIAAFAAIGQLL